jgi:cytochrome c-type protein NapB
MRRIARVGAIAAFCGLAGCHASDSPASFSPPSSPSPLPVTRDSDLGLVKGSVFEAPAPARVEPVESEPGKGDLRPRAFPGAPPVISHSLADIAPITRDTNDCITCHQVSERRPGEPTPIPESHFIDWRNAPGVKRAEVAGARWVCTLCHVRQTRATPPVPSR